MIFHRPALLDGTTATVAYPLTMRDVRKNTKVLAHLRRLVSLKWLHIGNVNRQAPSPFHKLAGVFLPASKQATEVSPPVASVVPYSPSRTGLNNSKNCGVNRLPIKIVVSGRQTRLRLPTVFGEVQGPFSILVALRCVAHESNRIGEFLSWVTNVLSRTTK